MPRRTAFTLIELMVVISIIAILAAMLVPAIGLVRTNAKSSRCQASLRQLHLGMLAYANDQDGKLPPAMIDYASGADLFWFGLTAPYVEGAGDDSGSINALKVGKGVIWGCPEYAAGTQNWVCGYGMNYWPREPVRYATNVRWTSYQSYPNPGSSYGQYAVFSLSQIDHVGSRPMLGDSDTWEFPRWVPTPPRHRGKVSGAFYDGHTEMITNPDLVAARDNPQ